VWSPVYEQNFALKNVTVQGNTVSGCLTGIWSLPSGGGSFSGCVVQGNHSSGNQKDYDIQGSGILFTPGARPGSGRRPVDSRVDIKPGTP
jgi:parallel beta-helix repeat protein